MPRPSPESILPAPLLAVSPPLPSASWGALRTAGALMLTGAAQALALAWPGTGQALWWLQMLSLLGFATLLRASPTARSALWRGWGFATVWLAGTFWWLFISMHTYGGLAAPLAALAVLALAAFLGSYYAIVSWCFWLLRPVGIARTAIIFAALWTLAELARGCWWTGFPWGAGGYAHTQGPLAALARWVGVYGIGAVAAALAMGVAALLDQIARRQRDSSVRWGGAAAMLVLLVALLIAAAWARDRALAQPALPALRVALLQGNIAQSEKFQAHSGIPQALAWYARQLRAEEADLVVAPETAIPVLPQQLPAGYLEALQARFERTDRRQAALVGIALGDEAQGYTNSVLGWSPTQIEPYRYDKHHLVPFGEFIPPLFKWFTQMMNIPLGDFDRGAVGQPSLVWMGQRIAPNICYEDLFGEELARRFANPAAAPTILVNMSNIAWFGDSLAIDQHLHISRMRALEFERPVVRATNTGATAIIDHHGQVRERLPALTQGVLRASVQGFEPITPYAHWLSRWGLAPLWALALALVLWGVLERFGRKSP